MTAPSRTTSLKGDIPPPFILIQSGMLK